MYNGIAMNNANKHWWYNIYTNFIHCVSCWLDNIQGHSSCTTNALSKDPLWAFSEAAILIGLYFTCMKNSKVTVYLLNYLYKPLCCDLLSRIFLIFPLDTMWFRGCLINSYCYLIWYSIFDMDPAESHILKDYSLSFFPYIQNQIVIIV